MHMHHRPPPNEGGNSTDENTSRDIWMPGIFYFAVCIYGQEVYMYGLWRLMQADT